MRVIRRTPFVVDGKLRTYHVVAPVLDKCAACYAKDPDPLCVTGCPGQALQDRAARRDGQGGRRPPLQHLHGIRAFRVDCRIGDRRRPSGGTGGGRR